MSLRIGCGLSEHPEARVGAIEAATQARLGLDRAAADLVLVFAAGAHLAAPEATLEGVEEVLAPDALVGCGAAGVVGAGREVEAGTAISVWAAAFEERRRRDVPRARRAGRRRPRAGRAPVSGGRERAAAAARPVDVPDRPRPAGARPRRPGGPGRRRPGQRARPATAASSCCATARCTPRARSASAWRASSCCPASPRAPRRSARS